MKENPHAPERARLFDSRLLQDDPFQAAPKLESHWKDVAGKKLLVLAGEFGISPLDLNKAAGEIRAHLEQQLRVEGLDFGRGKSTKRYYNPGMNTSVDALTMGFTDNTERQAATVLTGEYLHAIRRGIIFEICPIENLEEVCEREGSIPLVPQQEMSSEVPERKTSMPMVELFDEELLDESPGLAQEFLTGYYAGQAFKMRLSLEKYGASEAALSHVSRVIKKYMELEWSDISFIELNERHRQMRTMLDDTRNSILASVPASAQEQAGKFYDQYVTSSERLSIFSLCGPQDVKVQCINHGNIPIVPFDRAK